MGMVQAEMTHQAVADHFDVSRITIARQMMRLRQTGRTNDRPVTAHGTENLLSGIFP
jgi:transposase